MSARARVLVTRRLPEAVEARLRDEFDATLNAADRSLGPDDFASADVDGILTTVGDDFSAATIARLSTRVKVLATFSVGYDHIDVAAATGRGIVVTHTPDVLTDATADCALLLMLGAARRASEGMQLIHAKAWTGWRPTQLLGTHVTGKRLGIAGFGRIGQALARRARDGLGMHIHYHDVAPRPAAEERGATFHASLDAMLPHCDFLSLHLPSLPATRGILDARALALLPRGAIVVNTARGDLVNDAALIAALRSGHVAAAGLDVFAGEPRLDPGYLDVPNAMLLPHLGSATLDTREAMGFCAIDNLRAGLAGAKPPNRVG